MKLKKPKGNVDKYETGKQGLFHSGFAPCRRAERRAILREKGNLLTKIDIINLVSEDTGLSKVKAEEAVAATLQTIKEFLQSGESVILRRFGSFQVREKNARVGRNPKTGQEALIRTRRVVRFKAGKHFKDAVNNAEVKFY